MDPDRAADPHPPFGLHRWYAELFRVQSCPRPLAEPGGSLTAREAELLKMVAGGASNRHLADELGCSLDIVERHLRNIYSKLGVANRTEAATAHVRHHTEDNDLPY